MGRDGHLDTITMAEQVVPDETWDAIRPLASGLAVTAGESSA